MLRYKLLKNHGGITLIGDYDSLNVLHEIVHDVNKRSPIIRNKEGSFLGLAYDVRKAFERQREIYEPPKFEPEVGVMYGVQILWPVLLVQHRMLRQSLAFIDSTKKHQAITYALEWVIENALEDDFGLNAPAIKEQWNRIDTTDSYPEKHLISRGGLFSSWSKAQRAKLTANLLASLDSMYVINYKIRSKHGDSELISPDLLEDWEGRDWPDPKV